MINTGYWAVLPAGVRYDRSLTQTAKLLYAEISALAQVDGYCWATDKYFAELFLCSPATITRALRTLRDAGYIRIDHASNQKGSERHIYCGLDPAQGGIVKNDGTVEGTVKNDDRGTVKNDDTPLATQYNENKKKENTCARACAREGAIPSAALKLFLDFASGDPELEAALVHFGETKRWKKKPEYAARLLVNKLDKLSGGNHRHMIALLEKAIERGWESVFPLKPDELPEVAAPDPAEPERQIWTPGVTP